MKASTLAFAFLASVVLGANSATVESVTAKQLWPWSTDIKVKYVLSNVTEPTDLAVTAMNGGAALAVPARAITGDLHGITSDDEGGTVEGEFTIDPITAFGTAQAALTDLKIKVSAVASPANINEALYKIFDLTTGACTDVTRKDLLNGKWGAIETDYKAIDPNFKTDAEDVLIWTDVTNNPAYKTTHMVMRRIHAADKVWLSGDPAGTLKSYRDLFTQYWVKLTYDYYIAVFETTQAQYKKIVGSLYGTDCKYTDDPESSQYPVNGTGRYNVLGHPTDTSDGAKGVVTGEQIIFHHNTYVRDVGKNSTCATMWTRTGYEFNLPTGAEWEFACRGGNATPLYTGEAQTLENVNKIAWHSGVSGNKPAVVGSLAPNAYGLYDMLGNVFEQTTMQGNFSQGGGSGSGASADDPVVNPLGSTETTKDSHYSSSGTSFYNDSSTWEYYGSWQDCRSGVRCGNFNWFGLLKYVGFRFVCPVTKKWGADWPKTILDEEQEAAPVESVGTLYLGDERAATAGAGKANAKVLAYDECTTGGLLANIGKGILEKVDPQTVELFIGLNNVLTKPYADETPLDTVIGVREIATALRKQYPNAMIWINPLAYDADTEAENVRRYAINKACVEINEGNGGRMFMRQPDWMYVYPGTNPWPTDGNSALTPYISKYWLANADDPRLKKKLAEKRAHTAGSYDCVMVGDSVTHFWENANGKPYFDANIAPTWDVFNLGFGGDSTYHTIWNLLYSGLFDGYTTPLFTVLIGNNNISESSTDADLEKVAQGCKRILDILKAKHPESKIVLFPLLPRGNAPGALRTLSGKYNDLIREFADGTTVVWAGELWDQFLATADVDGNIPNNVFVDGVHPGTEGYRIWGEILKTYLPKKD